MLKQFDAKIEEAVRKAALEDFRGDFEPLGDLIKDQMEAVREKLGYSFGAGTPPYDIYEAIRSPIAAMHTMIETGKEPRECDPGGVVIAVNEKIKAMATAYINRAEVALANQVLEVVRELGKPEESKLPPAYQTDEPDLWREYLQRAGLEDFTPLLLNIPHFKCPSCGFDTEGYFVNQKDKGGIPLLYWRCLRPSCGFTSQITSCEVAGSEEGSLRPAASVRVHRDEEEEGSEIATLILASLKNCLWSEFRLEVKYAGVGLKRMGFWLEGLGLRYQKCPDCKWTAEGYQIAGVQSSYIRWRCSNPDCERSKAIQIEVIQSILPKEDEEEEVPETDATADQVEAIISEIQEGVSVADPRLTFGDHPYDFTVSCLHAAAVEIHGLRLALNRVSSDSQETEDDPAVCPYCGNDLIRRLALFGEVYPAGQVYYCSVCVKEFPERPGTVADRMCPYCDVILSPGGHCPSCDETIER